MLRQLLMPSTIAFRAAPLAQFQMANFSFMNEQQRFFAKKGKKGTKSEGEATDAEHVVDAEYEAAPVHHAPTASVQHDNAKFDWTREANIDTLDKPKLAAKFYQPFSVGTSIKKIDTVENHKPPSFEDTIEGRYAGALFISASKAGKLFEVYEDFVYLSHLYDHCEHFQLFTENSGIGLTQIQQLNQVLSETADFDAVTYQFLVVLAESKRLIYLKEIA